MSGDSLLTLNRKLIELDKEYASKQAEYNVYKSQYEQEKKRIRDKINALRHGINIEKYERGLLLLELDFPRVHSYRGEGKKYSMIYADLINSAKHDLCTGMKWLMQGYFGQKYYQGFDQRCDCEYGYGPSHGTIYQRIGLRDRGRNTLTDHDIECCLYVLENLSVVLENLNAKEATP